MVGRESKRMHNVAVLSTTAAALPPPASSQEGHPRLRSREEIIVYSAASHCDAFAYCATRAKKAFFKGAAETSQFVGGDWKPST